MSSPQVTEYHVTQEVFFSEDESLARRVFHVYNPANPTLALAAAGIPVLGEGFPEVTPGEGGTMVAVARRAEIIEGHASGSRLVKIEVDYRDKDKDLGKVTYDSQTIAQTGETWRDVEYNQIPVGGNVDNSSQVDILGIPVDINGQPRRFIRWSTELDINAIVRNDELEVAPGIFAVGTRNQTQFFGFPKGSMLFLGTRTFGELQDTKTVLQFRFLVDYYYHLVQAPGLDDSGMVALTVFSGIPGKHAKGVYWRQPYPVVSEFRQIHPILQQNAELIPNNQASMGSSGAGSTFA